MKIRTLLLLTILGCITWGCQSDNSTSEDAKQDTFEPQGDLADLVYNPVRSDGTVDSSYLPILTWEADVYDFGTIVEGDVITKDFTFTNTGTAPLLIINASSTCGCTIPEWPKDPIAPKGTGTIKVKFNSMDKRGDQNKVVTIFANTFPNKSTITIRGTVDIKN